MLQSCRFGTERLRVAPWHHELTDEALARFVETLLTPAVTDPLPTDWRGPYDLPRAMRWMLERDAESTVSLVRERKSGASVGLLIVTADQPAEPPLDLRIGYLLTESRWGRGLGSELIGGLVAWCRSTGMVGALAGGVEPGNPASARVLAEHGFTADGDAGGVQQTYRLHLPPSAVAIRSEGPDDADVIRAVVTAAFDSPVEAELVDRIRASPEYRPDLAMVAEVGGRIVGHVMISGALVRHAGGERSIVMLSPLAVAPDHQRHGVGASLVQAAVARAEAVGEPIVVLEGNPAYYSRFGFEHSVAFGLTLPLPDWAPSEAGQVLSLCAHDGLDPTLRGKVVYPVAFDGVDGP